MVLLALPVQDGKRRKVIDLVIDEGFDHKKKQPGQDKS